MNYRDLIILDHLADVGMSEMIGLMRLHVQEVTRFTTLIGLALTISEEQAEEFGADCEKYGVDSDPYITPHNEGFKFTPLGLFLVKICAKTHDIGKPFFRQIYSLERGLSGEEFDQQKLHAHLSRIIIRSWGIDGNYGISDLKLLNFIADMAAAHQEKYDGSGYPDQFSGKDIGFIGRLLAITDAISAMINPRPYQQPMPLYICLDRLQKDAGTHFDPDLIQNVVAILKAEGRNEERFSGAWRDMGKFSSDFLAIVKKIDFAKILLSDSDKEQLPTIKEVIANALKHQ